jgi:hypothetical protein
MSYDLQGTIKFVSQAFSYLLVDFTGPVMSDKKEIMRLTNLSAVTNKCKKHAHSMVILTLLRFSWFCQGAPWLAVVCHGFKFFGKGLQVRDEIEKVEALLTLANELHGLH